MPAGAPPQAFQGGKGKGSKGKGGTKGGNGTGSGCGSGTGTGSGSDTGSGGSGADSGDNSFVASIPFTGLDVSVLILVGTLMLLVGTAVSLKTSSGSP